MSNFNDPDLHKMRVSEAERLINYLSKNPLLPHECEPETIAALILDEKWLANKSYTTSREAQRNLDIGDFHSRWPDVAREIKKKNLPYEQFKYPLPNSSPQRHAYFLVKIQEGAKCNQLSATR